MVTQWGFLWDKNIILRYYLNNFRLRDIKIQNRKRFKEMFQVKFKVFYMLLIIICIMWHNVKMHIEAYAMLQLMNRNETYVTVYTSSPPIIPQNCRPIPNKCSPIASPCLSICPHAKTREQEILYWRILLNFVDTSQVWLKTDNNNRSFTLTPSWVSMCISRVTHWTIIGTKNISNKQLRQKWHTSYFSTLSRQNLTVV
jgi:hypothetical protein